MIEQVKQLVKSIRGYYAQSESFPMGKRHGDPEWQAWAEQLHQLRKDVDKAVESVLEVLPATQETIDNAIAALGKLAGRKPGDWTPGEMDAQAGAADAEPQAVSSEPLPPQADTAKTAAPASPDELRGRAWERARIKAGIYHYALESDAGENTVVSAESDLQAVNIAEKTYGGTWTVKAKSQQS